MKQLLPILAILLLSIIFVRYTFVETWQDYTLRPYNYIYSGRDPLYFYRRDRYRKPYRDGFKYYQSYPIPHHTPHQ